MDSGGQLTAGRDKGAMTQSGRTGRHVGTPDRAFKWVAALAAACLVGFVVFVVVRGSPHPASDSAALKAAPPPVLKTGTVAPGFSLPALHGADPVSLAAFRGTPVIVNFFASWCPDCRAELGAMATVARAHAGHLAVIGVDSNETSEAAASALLAAAGASYPVAVDAHADVASKYLVVALPVSYFVDSSGKLVGAALGPQTVRSLSRWLARLGVAGG